jgi:hypothetical protein
MPLQSQQRTRRRISPLVLVHSGSCDHRPTSPAPRLSSLSPFPWTDQAGPAGGPLRPGPSTRGGAAEARARCVRRHRLSVCLSCVFPAFALPAQHIGNHGKANTALLRVGQAGRGPGPPRATCDHPSSRSSSPPSLLPDRRPLTQSGFNKFIWVFNTKKKKKKKN